MGALKVLIAAGGSGGHIFPALALAARLKKDDAAIDIAFVGSNKDLDRRIFQKERFKHFLLSANSLPYAISPRTLLFLARLALDTVRSFFIVLDYRPSVVVGFGGYVSWPVAFAAFLLRVPRIIHEQNVVPGRANRALFRFVDKVALTFEETKVYIRGYSPKAIVTGNPIRASLVSALGNAGIYDRRSALKKFGLDENKFTMLVIGGSQGAHSLNEAVMSAMAALPAGTKGDLQVMHITGPRDYDWAVDRYGSSGIEHRIFSFIDSIEDAYCAADLVVTRSGSSAIFEIAFFGKPMILIPYPHAAAHQIENARVFSKRGAAIVIEEKDLSSDIFRGVLLDLFRSKDKLKDIGMTAKGMSAPEASGRLTESVLNLARKRRSCC